MDAATWISTLTSLHEEMENVDLASYTSSNADYLEAMAKKLRARPAALTRKLQFLVKLKYFKRSGKYYSSAEAYVTMTDCGPTGHPSAYMQDAVDWLNVLRNTDASAPGLSITGREFYVVLDCEHGYPVLVMPREGA